MKCCIFGGCLLTYIYIFFSVILFFVKCAILCLNGLNFDTHKNIFGIETVLHKHGLMQLLLEYLGYIIYGGIFLFKLKNNKIFIKKEKKEDQEQTIQRSNELIYEETYLASSNKAQKVMLLACLLYAIQLIVKNIMYFLKLYTLDLWIFNIIFILLFMKMIFKIGIYKHQLYSLIFNFVINFILLIVAPAIKRPVEGKEISDYDSIKEKFGNYYYIAIFYFVFLVLASIMSLSQVLQKNLMDFEYISPLKLLFIIGIFSLSFTLISSIITTFVNCSQFLTEHHLCSINSETDNNKAYFDNFKRFINNLEFQYKTDKAAFFIEVCIVYPLYPLACYLKHFCETMIIYHLDPNYILISETIYFGITKIISLTYNPKIISTYLGLLGDIIALIGYLIYLEIIQLKCCNMNFNTRINIYQRSQIESIGINSDYQSDNDSIHDNSDIMLENIR